MLIESALTSRRPGNSAIRREHGHWKPFGRHRREMPSDATMRSPPPICQGSCRIGGLGWTACCTGGHVVMTGVTDSSPGTHSVTPGRPSRRELLVSILRLLLTGALLVTAYYALPLDHLHGVENLVLLLVGGLAVISILAWQARSILRSRYPTMQGLQALLLVTMLWIVLYAAVDYMTGRSQHGAFTQSLTRTDALYFVVTLFSTVGFGDITPLSETARVLIMVQIFGDLLLLGFGLQVLVKAVQTAQQRRSATDRRDSIL
jgi:voltage-gated potassium channel